MIGAALMAPNAARERETGDLGFHGYFHTTSAVGSAGAAVPPWTDLSRDALRDSVTEYVRNMRARGIFPEKVLVAVKSAVRTAATAAIPHADVEQLVADAAQWCIAAYFTVPQEGRG
jgi:hypothetical protein